MKRMRSLAALAVLAFAFAVSFARRPASALKAPPLAHAYCGEQGCD